jgi:hypothetical protein
MIYDKFDLKLIEEIFNNKFSIKKHLRQYKLDDIMVDDFLVETKTNEVIMTISFDGDLIKKDGLYVGRFSN